MSKEKKPVNFFIKSLVTAILVLGLGYTIYTNLIIKNEAVTIDQSNLAPDFTLQDLKGNEVKLSDYRGKGVILNFWATYCPPCEKEMPYLNKVYQEYEDKGIEILAVNAQEPRIIVSPFVLEKKLSFSILLDRTGEAIEQYKVNNLPVTYLINEDGEITQTISGELTEKKVRSYVESIIPN
ncbi:thiol-disulfide oxidoreductase ResA [Peribacillus butanolivorans]|uniref:thiol-disulfide oxidoreductase ResA n=1 Tax=Peribacillus butanolivorans TaxID=421767 RepID=UPI00207CDC4D|nr:thiol-disulfide oxidoreductase ResA [Peribacillus butanolivorans]MCO0599880.1 thiol-disulfide oxidoreductase ResA [Peribacillus butanolivorans]